MNRKQIIALVFIGIILLIGYVCLTEETDKLSISIGGETQPKESFLSKLLNALVPADVGAILAEGGEELDVWTYQMSPGSSGTIDAGVFNTFNTHTWYKISAKQNGETFYISSQEFVAPYSEHDWAFTYNAPNTPGDYLIKIDAFKKNPFSDLVYWFDDSDHFTIRVVDDAPPDPCEGVSCPSKCIGETYYYAGYCVDGTCTYSNALVPGKCGYTIPIVVPDDTPDPEPDDTPTPDPVDPCEGISCPDKCVEPFTWLNYGVCINGVCEYTEESNSDECGYVESTAPIVTETPPITGEATPTPVAPDERDPGVEYSTPVDDDISGVPIPPEEPLNVYIVGAVLLLLIGATVFYIRQRD